MLPGDVPVMRSPNWSPVSTGRVWRRLHHGMAAVRSRSTVAPSVSGFCKEARRTPDREQDGTATWSLTTLQRALRQAPDGLPQVSTYTILMVLHEAGFTWQASQTWCETGKVKRKRKSGVVEVTDPDAEPKKS